MNLLDYLLLAAVLGFAFSGYRQGSVVGVLSLVGFVGGALAGAQLAAPMARAFGLTDSSGQSPGFGLIAVVAFAVVGQIIAAAIGARLRARLTWKPLRALDSIAGALVSAVSVLLVAWALGHVVVRTDHPQIRAEVTGSAILTRVDDLVPGGADALLATVLRLVNQTGFPAVFPGLGIESIVPVAPPDPSVLAEPGVNKAYPSTYKILGIAPSCTRQIEGSGFIFAKDHVMTNAHVVAGVMNPMVLTPSGQKLEATVVLFDPNRDVAVLDVPGLTGTPLSFAGPLADGANAVVAGYPLNGSFAAGPARVRSRKTTPQPQHLLHRHGGARRIRALRGGAPRQQWRPAARRQGSRRRNGLRHVHRGRQHRICPEFRGSCGRRHRCRYRHGTRLDPGLRLASYRSSLGSGKPGGAGDGSHPGVGRAAGVLAACLMLQAL